LLGCAAVVSYKDEVLKQWRVDLFVLGRNQHGCDTYKLNVPFVDLVLRKIPVDDVDCQEQGLRQKFEIVMNLNNPVDESTPNGLAQFALDRHIVALYLPLGFSFEHVRLNGSAVFAHLVDVGCCRPVHFVHGLED
jgi:hypothetical protein